VPAMLIAIAVTTVAALILIFIAVRPGRWYLLHEAKEPGLAHSGSKSTAHSAANAVGEPFC
jgi:hypothetical protein